MTTEFLEHYGKKGMKWGVRKSKTRRELAIENSRRNIKKNRKQISDSDLENYIKRLQNEKKLKDLIDEDLNPGKTVTKRVLGESGQKVAKTVVAGAGILAVKLVLDKKFSKTLPDGTKDMTISNIVSRGKNK